MATGLFLGLLTGCGGDSAPPNNTSIVPSIKLSSEISSDTIHLYWNSVNEATEYILEWSQNENILDNNIVLAADKTEYLHKSLEPDTIYYYRITVKFSDGTKKESSEIMAVKTGSIVQIMQSDAAY